MTPTSGDTLPVLPDKAHTYLDSQLKRIVKTMRAKMDEFPDERRYWVTITLRCPRPKDVSRSELIYALESHLTKRLEQFENETFATHVYINGVSDEKRYHIRWTPAAAHEETTHD